MFESVKKLFEENNIDITDGLKEFSSEIRFRIMGPRNSIINYRIWGTETYPVVDAWFGKYDVVGCSGGMGDGCCGWSAKEITGSGQVKKVSKQTPMVCPDYYEVDISMGVMRNGVGSMSTHDITIYIDDKFAKDLQAAAQTGEIIDFTYDIRRVDWCVNQDRLTSFDRTK